MARETKHRLRQREPKAKKQALPLELAPQTPDGYDETDDVIVRLVSRHRPKYAYRTTGIEDVVSRNNWKAWIYLAPIIVLISVFLLYPLVNTIFIAFTSEYNYAAGTGKGFTLENFGMILGLSEFNGAKETKFLRYAIPNTFFLTFVTVPISIVLALIISVALNSIRWFQKFLQTVFFLPYVTNAIAVGMVFSVMFDQNGIINSLLGTAGTDDAIAWMKSDQWTAMIPLVIYIVWHAMPFKILIFLSGLQNIDKQYYQAAQIDAAPKWKVLWRITVPLLSPQILYIMITSFIAAFKEYTSIVGLFNAPETQTGTGNMMTVVYYVYDNLVVKTSWAAAAAVFLFVVILIFTAIQFAVSKKRVHY